MSHASTRLLSRRGFLTCVTLSAASVTVARLAQAQGTELPHLSPSEPMAKALAYTEDASKVDPKTESIFRAGRLCGNCKFFQAAQAKGDYAPCLIFPGKSVNIKGWCRAWAAKG